MNKSFLIRRIGNKLIVIVFCFSFFSTSLAQKPCINNESFQSWDALINYGISNDGRYIWYVHGSMSKGNGLVVKSADNSVSKTYHDIIGEPKFTSDSKYAIFLVGDSLNVLNLSTISLNVISNVSSFSLPKDGHAQFISYQSNGRTYLLNLSTKKIIHFPGGKFSLFNDQGSALVIAGDSSLYWLCIETLMVKKIIDKNPVGNVVFDFKGTGLAFCPRIKGVKSLFYYRENFVTPIELVGPSNFLMDGREMSYRSPQFTKDSKKIFFGVTVQKGEPSQGAADTDVPSSSTVRLWHYKDEYMQSTLSRMSQNSRVEVLAVVGVSNKEIMVLEQPDSTSIVGGNGRGNEYVITNTVGNFGEQNWNRYKKKYELISLKERESSKCISELPIYTMPPKLSSDEGFISWYDYKEGNYFTYQISSGKIRCVTASIKYPLASDNNEKYADLIGFTYGYFWLANDKGLLVYDQYDIWQVDPYGLKSPINITGGVGRKNRIVFRLAADEYAFPAPGIGDTLLLAAFDTESKKNGLFKTIVGKSNKPDVCNMSNDIYYFPWMFVERTPKEPIKAKYANVYVLQHMNTLSSPNVCITTDFIKFTILSDIQPQRRYNWMTADLIKWQQENGRELHGILYKPENFDSTKKYPIIFHYYDQFSHQLNLFRTPEPSPGALNIAWYVSNGYLVFLPDIHIPSGRPAKGIVESVESSIRKLKSFQWIDTNRMGLEGHSFGGYETYVLMTNTNHFAAAQASAGVSDFISGYSSLGGDFAHLYEVGQNNMRTTPWERPDLYIECSPIFRVGNVNTPLLIMHNENDGAVDFSQALEMYVAIRRQKKPVWLLQYEGEGHTLGNPNNVMDFSIRQQQFFSHYLKGTPAPQWMKEPSVSNFRFNPVIITEESD